MRIKNKLAAVAVTVAAAGSMAFIAPTAQASSCGPNGPGGWICSDVINGGHKISVLFYGDSRTMAGWDNAHYYTHLDRSLNGGKTWEGPLATGQGWSKQLNRGNYVWRACSNVEGRYHCTSWH